MSSAAFGNQQETDRRLARAAAWRVTLSEADAETSEAFETWLAQDPRNAEAWAHMQAVWDRFGDDAIAPELMAARRETLARASRSQAERFRRAHRPLWTPSRIAASAAATVLLAGMAASGVWYGNRPDVYRTELGERRTVLLADGSRVALDSGTVLKVRLLADARKLDLIQGQARFDVAHDVTRPFEVHARDQTVVATGTSFNVDLIGHKVLVTLIEGAVSVLRDRPPRLLAAAPQTAAPVLARLTSGETLVSADAVDPSHGAVVAAAPPVVVEKVNLDKATAWESGQLVFDDEPLSSVAERVSRYAAHPVTAQGAAGTLRISGVFNAGDTATFIDTVERAFPIQAAQADDGSVTLRPRG
jgi:transmembrane sensor